MSFGDQSNVWDRNMMHPQSNFQGPPQQMFMQTQSNMAVHGGGGGMYPNFGGGGGGENIQYPRTGLNPVAFQGSGGGGMGGGAPGMPQHYNYVGTVTKINNDCGLVNNEVFFYRNVCKGPEPKLGDRVIFEATYSTSGQFKWNATRIQLMQTKPAPIMNTSKANYGSPVPIQNDYQRGGGGGHIQRHSSPKRGSPPIRGDRHERGDRRDRERERERERHHRSRDRNEVDYSQYQ